jgi:ABC-type bacteriocin/lantibiotic exporter with double-glycine peptidase domain
MRDMISKIYYIFTPFERLQLLGVFMLMLVGAGLETVGVGLILPFMYLFSDPTIILEDPRLRWFYDAVGISSPATLLVWLGIGLIVFFFLKNSYLLLSTYLQARFLARRYVAFSSSLLGAYFYFPYTFHLQHNSAQLLLNVEQETRMVFQQFLTNLLQLMSDALLLILIVGLLLVVDFTSSLIAMSIIVASGLLFFRIFRRKSTDLGKQRREHQLQMIQWLKQGFGSVKETKILHRERFFIDSYTEHCRKMADANQFMKIAAALPRLLLEVIIVAAAISIMLIVLVQGQDVQAIIPTLALFAVASFRLMPAASRMLKTVAVLQFHKSSLDSIYDDIAVLQAEYPEQNRPAPVLWRGRR